MTAASLTIEIPRARDFVLRMQELLEEGALALMTSFGHRAGLFAAMAGAEAATADELARQLDLDVDAVRAWLTAMERGGIVCYGGGPGLYELPHAHSACLADPDLAGSLAEPSRWMALLATARDAAPDRGRARAEEARSTGRPRRPRGASPQEQATLDEFTRSILPQVPGLEELLEGGACVLDLACGDGVMMNALALGFARSRFWGLDRCSDEVDAAQWRAHQLGLGNAHFWINERVALGRREPYDVITAAQPLEGRPDLETLLRGARKALRPGGMLLLRRQLSADEALGLPEHSPLHALARFRGRTTGDALPTMLHRLGFSNVATHLLHHDVESGYVTATVD